MQARKIDAILDLLNANLTVVQCDDQSELFRVSPQHYSRRLTQSVLVTPMHPTEYSCFLALARDATLYDPSFTFRTFCEYVSTYAEPHSTPSEIADDPQWRLEYLDSLFAYALLATVLTPAEITIFGEHAASTSA